MLPGHPSHFIADLGDPHHVTKRSKARDDRLINLLYCCRASHNEIDRAPAELRAKWEANAKEILRARA